jgi:glycosyltransferase involved in cell wall biosynthesis
LAGDLLHIGFYCPGWPANEYPSGIVTYVHHLRTELIKQGHRVSVFVNQLGSTSRDERIYEINLTPRFRFHKILNWLTGRGSYDVFDWGLAIGQKVREVHRADPIDVLEMEESFGWCASVQKLTTIPIVVRLHGPEFLTRISALANDAIAEARNEREGNALQKIAAIVSPSRSTLLETVSRYHLRPSVQRVIPNPVLRDPEAKQWDLDRCDGKTILFVGQFSKVKGGDIALLAFKRLLDSDYSLRLIFVGPDVGIVSETGKTVYFEEFIDALFTKNQKACISYLGQLNRSAIFDIRVKAMVTILASRWENQPNAALEAMAQGCPIVAVDVGGISEIIRNDVTGLLAKPGDTADFCQKIVSLIRDPFRARQLGNNAFKYVCERHAAQLLAKDVVATYRDAISLSASEK